eukprot:scaffold44023_cov21-Tisochrysis_lutea.AAC.2
MAALILDSLTGREAGRAPESLDLWASSAEQPCVFEENEGRARQQLQRSKQKGNAITITSANRVPRLRQKSRDTTWWVRT